MQAVKTAGSAKKKSTKKKTASKKAAQKKTTAKKVVNKFGKGISYGIDAMTDGTKKIGDFVCGLPKNSVTFVTEVAPGFGLKARDIIVKGVSKASPMDIMKDMGASLGIGEWAPLKSKIKELNKKIRSLQLELGRERSSQPLDRKTESEKIGELVAKIKIFEGEVKRLKQCIEKPGVPKEGAKAGMAKKTSPKKQFKQVKQELEAMTYKILRKKNAFESEGQKCVFSNAVKGLFEEDIEKRIMAVSELGRIGHRESLALLKGAFSYGNSNLDSEIVSAMININDPSVLPVLREKLEDTNYRVRLESLRGIYKFEGKEAIYDLLSSIYDDHASVRRTAVTCLGWCGDRKAVPSLIESLNDRNKEVRKATALALGDIRDTRAVDPLIEALAIGGKDLREKIKYALSRITRHDIPLNTALSGKRNLNEIKKLQSWWEKISAKS